MFTIEITDEFTTLDQVCLALERVAELIQQGYTSGYEPGFHLSGEETARFRAGENYPLLGGAYDEDNPQYDHVQPVEDDNGTYWVIDCWITDSQGNIHPGYNASPCPIDVNDFIEE